jgi:hypothetical protein
MINIHGIEEVKAVATKLTYSQEDAIAKSIENNTVAQDIGNFLANHYIKEVLPVLEDDILLEEQIKELVNRLRIVSPGLDRQNSTKESRLTRRLVAKQGL